MTKPTEDERKQARLALHKERYEAATNPDSKRQYKKAMQFVSNGDYEITGGLKDSTTDDWQETISAGQSAQARQLKAAKSPKPPGGLIEAIRSIYEENPSFLDKSRERVWNYLAETYDTYYPFTPDIPSGAFEAYIEDERTFRMTFTTSDNRIKPRHMEKKTFLDYVGSVKKEIKR